MKTVDDYMREAFAALLKGDTERRDECCRQAERLLKQQREGGAEAWLRQQGIQPIKPKVPAVICLPDRSGETLQ